MTIQLNATETKRMLDAKAAIDDMLNRPAFGHGNIMDHNKDEIVRCYNGIISHVSHSGCIMYSDAAVNFFKKLGFIVKKSTEDVFDVYISARMRNLYGSL